MSLKSLSLALYSVSFRFDVVGEKLCLSTSKKISNPGFEVILPRRHHGDKFQKIGVRGQLENGFPDIFFSVR